MISYSSSFEMTRKNNDRGSLVKEYCHYGLDLETFMDANGHGVGDFEGLTRRLEYLQALGISTIWLSPFQPTPNRDNGYDISDFYGVDPRHGSSDDIYELIKASR
jgi:maltose alpha-D-glucosyltransferase / alpha-amylase